ncbi:uncharacterized protein LOC108667682 [Hyalella azteca]|uniref:Uncharacterized protein LOC108667682 n=1 Tax=Hyalella azteca TaxID=294128 RepID=A0A8B7N9Q5_HYAAZ|nr:uncharacterized protein LOC108667682 [Hyalella azteca]
MLVVTAKLLLNLVFVFLLIHGTQGVPVEDGPALVRGPSLRKIVTFDWDLWPLWYGERYVAYRFGDAIVDQSAVAAGIAEFEQNTCLIFEKVNPAHFGPHIVIKNHNSVCSSFIGRKYTYLLGQDMFLTKQCASDLALVVARQCFGR